MMRSAALAVVLVLATTSARAQAVSDLVQVWLKTNNISAPNGSWSTCQPAGQIDQICGWSAALGAQPTMEQLQALVPQWQNMQAAQQAPAILAAGLVVTSTSTPLLNGTYALTASAQFNTSAEIVSILANGVFTNGQATKPWPDAAGAVHVFNISQFKALATVESQFIDGVNMAAATLATGVAASWPSNQVVIP